jgi:hypothetical protein
MLLLYLGQRPFFLIYTPGENGERTMILALFAHTKREAQKKGSESIERPEIDCRWRGDRKFQDDCRQGAKIIVVAQYYTPQLA